MTSNATDDPRTTQAESWPTAPKWAPLLIIACAALAVAAFVVGIPPITHEDNPTPEVCTDDGFCTDADGTDSTFTECGSVFLTNSVSTFEVGGCEGALRARRLTELSLAAGAVLLAVFGARRSVSVWRMRTRAWEAFFAVGVFATFLFVWTLLAWLLEHLSAYEPS